jgi:hypothetical protein
MITESKEEKVKVYAWRESSEDFYYHIQIQNIQKRSVKKVIREVEEWNNSGSGFNSKIKRHILLFRRSFKCKKDFLSWAKKFPYEVYLENKKGIYKLIK